MAKLPKGLYAILDLGRTGDRPPLETATLFLEGGGSILQLRAKGRPLSELLPLARQLRALTARYGVPFIVNDSVELAIKSGAAGVHLGQKDLDIRTARKEGGCDLLIGLSTHTREEVERAQELPLDYIAFGPIFPTESKVDSGPPVGVTLLKEVVRKSRLPVVAIGGITPHNLPSVLEAKPHAIALIGGLLTPTPQQGVQAILEGWRRGQSS